MQDNMMLICMYDMHQAENRKKTNGPSNICLQTVMSRKVESQCKRITVAMQLKTINNS